MKKLLQHSEKNVIMFADYKSKKGGNDDKTRICARGGGGKSSLDKGFGLFKAIRTACNYLHRNSKVVLILSFCLITTAVLAAGRCVPCKLNHYCVDGLRYQCPANTPVTQGTGAGALNECLTCTQRNGNSANPIYDDLVGDCVSCYEYNSDTPYWDGTTCSACPSGTLWNSESLVCEEVQHTCAYEIPHGDGTLCLVENVDYTAFEAISPQSAEDETAEFLSKYGIANPSTRYPDYWAGAMKYCQDKGLRLPTMEELYSIMNAVYGISESSSRACYNPNSAYVGEQYGCNEEFGSADSLGVQLSISNIELRDFLKGANHMNYFGLYSNAESFNSSAYDVYFSNVEALFYEHYRDYNSNNALCVK